MWLPTTSAALELLRSPDAVLRITFRLLGVSLNGDGCARGAHASRSCDGHGLYARAWHIVNWIIAHASCLVTQPPSLANRINILVAPCRITLAFELCRNAWRILLQNFNSFPTVAWTLDSAGVADFLLKLSHGTSPWNEPLVEVVELK